MSQRETRRLARETAMQALFQVDQNRDMSREALDEFISGRIVTPGLQAFAWEIFDGVRANLTSIDAILTESAENWKVGRMSAVDRNVLRIAVYELRFRTDTPPKVAINEAIDICKRFSTADSAAFVNGILDRIAARQ
jgi:N utilization substance protein B